jgi:hypothetical protein
LANDLAWGGHRRAVSVRRGPLAIDERPANSLLDSPRHRTYLVGSTAAFAGTAQLVYPFMFVYADVGWTRGVVARRLGERNGWLGLRLRAGPCRVALLIRFRVLLVALAVYAGLDPITDVLVHVAPVLESA